MCLSDSMILQRVQIGTSRGSHRRRSLGCGMGEEGIGTSVRRAEQARGGSRGTIRSPGRNGREGWIIVGKELTRLVRLLRIHGGKRM